MAAVDVDTDRRLYVTGIALTAAEQDIRLEVVRYLRASGFEVHDDPDPRIQRGGTGGAVDALKIAWSLISAAGKIYFWFKKTVEQRAKAWREGLRPVYQVKIRMGESWRPAKDLLVVLPGLVEILRRDYPMFTYHFEVDGLEGTLDRCYLSLPEQAISDKNLRQTYRLLDKRQYELTCIYWQIKPGLLGGWRSRMWWGESMAAIAVVRFPLQRGSSGHWSVLRHSMPGRWR